MGSCTSEDSKQVIIKTQQALSNVEKQYNQINEKLNKDNEEQLSKHQSELKNIEEKYNAIINGLQDNKQDQEKQISKFQKDLKRYEELIKIRTLESQKGGRNKVVNENLSQYFPSYKNLDQELDNNDEGSSQSQKMRNLCQMINLMWNNILKEIDQKHQEEINFYEKQISNFNKIISDQHEKYYQLKQEVTSQKYELPVKNSDKKNGKFKQQISPPMTTQRQLKTFDLNKELIDSSKKPDPVNEIAQLSNQQEHQYSFDYQDSPKEQIENEKFIQDQLLEINNKNLSRTEEDQKVVQSYTDQASELKDNVNEGQGEEKEGQVEEQEGQVEEQEGQVEEQDKNSESEVQFSNKNRRVKKINSIKIIHVVQPVSPVNYRPIEFKIEKMNQAVQTEAKTKRINQAAQTDEGAKIQLVNKESQTTQNIVKNTETQTKISKKDKSTQAQIEVEKEETKDKQTKKPSPRIQKDKNGELDKSKQQPVKKSPELQEIPKSQNLEKAEIKKTHEYKIQTSKVKKVQTQQGRDQAQQSIRPSMLTWSNTKLKDSRRASFEAKQKEGNQQKEGFTFNTLMDIINRQAQSLYNKGDITDIFEFEIQSSGICLDNQVLYDIKPDNTIIKEDLQVREIHCLDFQDAQNIMDHICAYQMHIENQECNKNEFQKIYKYWSERIQDKFIVFVIQEKLLSINQYINQTQEMTLTEYMNFYNMFKNLDQQLTKSGGDRCLEFIYSQLSLTVDNVFIKNKKDLIFSFRYEQTFSTIKRDRRWQFKDFIARFSSFLCSISQKMRNVKIKDYGIAPNNMIKSMDLLLKNPVKILNQSRQGTVYSLRYENKDYCLKTITKPQFEDISIIYQNSILYQQQHALIKQTSIMEIKEIFLKPYDKEKDAYTLGFLMDIAETNLSEIIKNYRQPPDLKTFFPILRDTIIALTFLHKKSISHRDIKPTNILKVGKNKYVLSDYVEGTNLKYECKYLTNTFFQIIKLNPLGTIAYLDPLLYDLYVDSSDSNYQSSGINLDIFKADIFSLGLTLYQAVTGEDPCYLNQSEDMQIIAYEKIHQLNLPLCIRQLILHMISYKQKDRIPSATLYYCLRNIQELLKKGFQHAVKHGRKEKQESQKRYFDMFQGQYASEWDPCFGRKLLDISALDQSYYIGQLKILPSNIKEPGKLKLVKPLFVPYLQVTKLKKGQKIKTNKNFIPVQLPKYSNRIKGIKQIQKHFQMNGLFYKDFICNESDALYCTQKEQQAFLTGQTFYSFISQKNNIEEFLFNFSYDSKEWEIIKKNIYCLVAQKQTAILRLVQRRHSTKKVDSLSPQLPSSLFVVQLILENCNLDNWDNFDIQFKYPMLQNVHMYRMNYYSGESLKKFLKSLLNLRLLETLELEGITYNGYVDQIQNPFYNLIKIIEFSPIKYFQFMNWESRDLISYDNEFLVALLKAINKKDLLTLKLKMTVQANDEEGEFKFTRAITQFFKSQTKLEKIYFDLNLYNTNIGIEVLQILPEYIKSHIKPITAENDELIKITRLFSP